MFREEIELLIGDVKFDNKGIDRCEEDEIKVIIYVD